MHTSWCLFSRIVRFVSTICWDFGGGVDTVEYGAGHTGVASCLSAFRILEQLPLLRIKLHAIVEN